MVGFLESRTFCRKVERRVLISSTSLTKLGAVREWYGVTYSRQDEKWQGKFVIIITVSQHAGVNSSTTVEHS